MTSENITISLTRYDEPNWLVWETLESIARQREIRAEVLFLDQAPDKRTEIHLAGLCNANIRFKYIHVPRKSLSFARNYAVKNAANDIILFIDSDAIADHDWAHQLSELLLRRGGAIAGGKILPKWHKRPLAITRANVVREQYSLLDLGNVETRFSKIVGAGFGINRKMLGPEAYFNEKFGRRNGILFGGEETDLCERALRDGLSIYYNGKAVVHHQILPERITYKWIFKRIYYSGICRALKKGRPEPTHRMGIWDYVVLPIILPWYATGYLHGKLAKNI